MVDISIDIGPSDVLQIVRCPDDSVVAFLPKAQVFEDSWRTFVDGVGVLLGCQLDRTSMVTLLLQRGYLRIDRRREVVVLLIERSGCFDRVICQLREFGDRFAHSFAGRFLHGYRG
ncbi:hypothetical protein D3C85_1426820 [compost metagenome]